MKHRHLSSIVLTLAATLVGCGPKAEDYRALETHARTALARAEANQTAMLSAFTAALAQPAGPAGGCTPAMVERGRERLENFTKANLAGLPTARTSRFAAMNSWVTTHSLYFDGHISLKHEDLARMNREVDEIDHSRAYEIVMVRTAWTAPVVAGGSYSPGRYEGRLFVWDSNAGRIVCTAAVNTSAPGTVTTYGGEQGAQVAGALVEAAETQAFAAAGLGERGPLSPFVSNSP